MIERARVQPLHEVSEIVDAHFRHAAAGFACFAEAVGRVDGGGEDGRHRGEDLLVHGDDVFGRSDQDRYDGLEELPDRRMISSLNGG